MMIGYGCVSKRNVYGQIDQLIGDSTEKVIQEKYTGNCRDRPVISTFWNL